MSGSGAAHMTRKESIMKNNNQTKIINVNINGSENESRFQCNIGIEINNSIYDIMLTELAGNARRAAEYNSKQHNISMLKLRLEELKLLKELKELEESK